ncbi:MAG: ABC transporter permease, partial [Clostridia bacterium]
NASAFPMTFQQLAAYIWLQQAFMPLVMNWLWDMELFESIQTGGVAYELTRPVNLYAMWYVKLLALRLSKAALRCLPVLAVALLLPPPYRLMLPADMGSFVLFAFTLVLSTLTVVAFGMPIYISAFYMVSPLGLRIVVATFADFFCGALIPLPFFPDEFRAVLELLPFGAMQNLPLLIYSGSLTGMEALRGVCVQLGWLAALVALGAWWMRRAVRKTVVQGG